MSETVPYQQLANAAMMLHLAIVAFVMCGLLLVLVGNRLKWPWVNSLWFRIVHLATIAMVVAESWFNLPCPITVLESWLRSRAGETAHGEDFIEHWLQTFLYIDAPTWAFDLAYTIFGLLVVAAWWYFPPRRSK
jgi:Protein of Unknown function (DUF2784)